MSSDFAEHSRGVRTQNLPIRIADFILRKFAGQKLVAVKHTSDDDYDPIKGVKEFLGDEPQAIEDLWAFMQKHNVFLLQGRAFGCQIGITTGLKAVLEDRYGDAATSFFNAHPLHEICGNTMAHPNPPRVAIANIGGRLEAADCTFIVAKQKDISAVDKGKTDVA